MLEIRITASYHVRADNDAGLRARMSLRIISTHAISGHDGRLHATAQGNCTGQAWELGSAAQEEADAKDACKCGGQAGSQHEPAASVTIIQFLPL